MTINEKADLIINDIKREISINPIQIFKNILYSSLFCKFQLTFLMQFLM